MSTEVQNAIYSGVVVAVTCGSCDIHFGVPKSFKAAREKDGNLFYCPNGCHVGWKETEADRLKKELETAEAQKTWWVDYQRQTADRFLDEKRAHSATKGQLTKTKKRAVAGLCPCCSRSFVDVRRHMANKHPGEAVAGLGDGLGAGRVH